MALSDHEKMMLDLGAAVRLHVPMGDRVLWREYVEHLRGLCTDLDFFAHAQERPDLTEYDMHLKIKTRIAGINRISRRAAARAGIEIKDGRPPDAKRKRGQPETTETVSGYTPISLGYRFEQR